MPRKNSRLSRKPAFTLLSWNVKHFGRGLDPSDDSLEPPRPVGPIVKLIAEQGADVVAIYEVVGAEVFGEVMRRMPGYQFFITEGTGAQEILVGVRREFPAFFTQKLEFQSGQSTLRPGALLTLRAGGELYTLLFLHLKSFTDPKGFGLRDDMLARALRLRSVLDDAARREARGARRARARSNYLFLGDLNTMGLNLTYSSRDVSAAAEIERLHQRAARAGMRLLEKSHPTTYWPGSGSSLEPGDLDHIVAAGHLPIGGDRCAAGWTAKRTAAAMAGAANTRTTHCFGWRWGEGLGWEFFPRATPCRWGLGSGTL